MSTVDLCPEMCILAAIKEGNMKRDPFTNGYITGLIIAFILCNAVWIIVTAVL